MSKLLEYFGIGKPINTSTPMSHPTAIESNVVSNNGLSILKSNPKNEQSDQEDL